MQAKKEPNLSAWFFQCWRYLFSRPVTRQVSSAEVSLTSVFGMGTGGPSPQSTPTMQEIHPENRTPKNFCKREAAAFEPAYKTVGQALGLLVSVSYTHYCASTPDLSTTWSTSSLTPFQDERSYLRGSFTLRCLQRLSRPDVATQLCPWQDNWCTRGLSIPVLSY